MTSADCSRFSSVQYWRIFSRIAANRPVSASFQQVDAIGRCRHFIIETAHYGLWDK
jgi:hypothetical protein